MADAKKRMIAVLNEDGVLIDKIQNPSEAKWQAASPHCRFPEGFDNALHRYRLIEWTPGRWRFEPILHPKEKAKENTDDDLEMTVGELASFVWALSCGFKLTKRQQERIARLVGSHDNLGFVPKGEQRRALGNAVSDLDGEL